MLGWLKLAAARVERAKLLEELKVAETARALESSQALVLPPVENESALTRLLDCWLQIC